MPRCPLSGPKIEGYFALHSILNKEILVADGLGCLRYAGNIVMEAYRSPPTPDLDDLELMSRIRARQPEALRFLYQRHAAALFALCVRIVNDRSEAEQLLIDVFWEIWERADRYDAARAAPLTYFTILTRSRALDVLRRRKAGSGESAPGGAFAPFELDATQASPTLPPLNQLLASERSQSVREALFSLDDDERKLIEACFFDGYTHAQIAAKLKQPLGTVKTRIRRGLARLRGRLRLVFDEPQAIAQNAADGDSESQ
jgi:RNA polymerase sigma-70 factor (ECF subfamily)